MKISYADYIKKSDASALVAEAIFHDLNKKYPIKIIEEVADTTSGGTPLRGNHDYYGGNIPWLKSGELNDGFIDKAEEYITEKGLANSSAKLHPEGTLLIAMYGATVGKTAITRIKTTTNQAICAVFPKPCIDRDYLFWFFKAHRYKYIEMSKGGAQPNISQTVILKTPLPLPDIDVQKEITSILELVSKSNDLDLSLIPDEYRPTVSKVFSSKSNVTALETELNNQNNLLSQLRQSFLREAMQGKLVKQDPNDGHAKDLLDKIKAEKAKSGRKEKELPPIKPEEIPFEIPDNWVWCRLGEICNYGSSPKAEAKDIKSDTWVLDLEDIEKETSRLLCRIRYSERKSLSTKSVFKKGDVLYSKLRPYLDKVIVADEEGVCTTEILPLKLFGGLNPYLVRYALKRTDFLSYVNSVTKGMKMPRLGTKEGQMALIPLPPLPEQKRIVEMLDRVLRLCDDLQESIQTTHVQNELLLQQVLKEALME